jgi:hypothetical protein
VNGDATRGTSCSGVISAMMGGAWSRPPSSLGAQRHPIGIAYDVLIWRCASSSLWLLVWDR